MSWPRRAQMIDPVLLTNFISKRLILAGENEISVLKVQKLLYYVQAWNLALYNEALFDEDFEAWVHGPVCPSVFKYHRHGLGKFMYSNITEADLRNHEFNAINATTSSHVDAVLEIYGKFSGAQLEEFTHREKPWLNARNGLQPYESSKNVISKDSIKEFYKSLIPA